MPRVLAPLASCAALVGALATAITSAPPAHAQEHRCARHAVEQAKKLVRFHYGDASESGFIGDGTRARAVAPVRALVGNATFDVLEVVATIYKAEYRMRFIYARIPGDCTLMGQEIFERSNPG